MRSLGSAQSLLRADNLAETSVTTTSRGFRIGSRELSASQVEFVPQNMPGVWINDHQYRGTVRLYRRSGNKIVAVNVLPLEEYVASVVDSEMPAEFGAEARKAQAIVARTYALYQKRSAASGSVVDLYATVRSQKYLGVQYRSGGRSLAGESAGSREVTAETKGQVCTTGGQLFSTYYCATCGGQTMRGIDFFPDAAAPLQSVPCEWCRAATLYRWEVDAPRGDWQERVRKKCAAEGVNVGTPKSIRLLPTAGPGRMPQFEVRGDAATCRLTGANMRDALAPFGAHSPRFTVEERGGSLHLRGSGNGHGVGLCQWGARGQGQSGRTALQIVRHYYPGAAIVVVDYP